MILSISCAISENLCPSSCLLSSVPCVYRIYSRFSSKKMQELSEAGLMNFLLLFLVVARQVELEDVANRACELLGFLPSNCPLGHRTLVWRGQLSLVLLFQVYLFIMTYNKDGKVKKNSDRSPRVCSRRGVWMLGPRLVCWLPPLTRRPRSFTTRPQRSLADSPSGGHLAPTWRAWLRCSRRAPASACRRRSCSGKGSIGCCLRAASPSWIPPWAFCRSSLRSSGERAGVNIHQLPGISYFSTVSLALSSFTDSYSLTDSRHIQTNVFWQRPS